MKRIGRELFDTLISYETIFAAIDNACRNHRDDPEVRMILDDKFNYAERVRNALINGTFRSSGYDQYTTIEGGKERLISKVRSFFDRIVHWCIILTTRDIFINRMIPTTYGALKGRGTHRALKKLRKYLKDVDGTLYVLKMDVYHFFESVDKDILMGKLGRVFKDRRILDLFHEVVYGYTEPGLPIGDLTSQYLANFYLSDLDHHMKERFHARYYIRYMDDIIILGRNKRWLRRALKRATDILTSDRLRLNHRYQISPVADRGVNFVGYRSFHTHTLLRSRIKHNLYKATSDIMSALSSGGEVSKHIQGVYAAYKGVLKWCDSKHLSDRTLGRIDRYVQKNSAEFGKASVLDRRCHHHPHHVGCS